MTNNTKLALYTAYCIGVGAGVTYFVEELKHKNELLEMTTELYQGLMDVTKEMLKPAPRYSYSRSRSYDYVNDSNKEKKNETMA